MEMEEKIVDYIKEKYSPQTIIVYGSFANGTNNMNSDFDALVIVDTELKIHDVSFCGNTQLDVFIYPKTYFEKTVDYDEILQIYDGKIIWDTNKMGSTLKDGVVSYIDSMQKKTSDELWEEIIWCKKMLERTKRNDSEGMFRWHWLLTESLQIYCEIKQIYYFGPKKMIKWMRENDCISHEIYSTALSHFKIDTLEKWINRLEEIYRI